MAADDDLADLVMLRRIKLPKVSEQPLQVEVAVPNGGLTISKLLEADL